MVPFCKSAAQSCNVVEFHREAELFLHIVSGNRRRFLKGSTLNFTLSHFDHLPFCLNKIWTRIFSICDKLQIESLSLSYILCLETIDHSWRAACWTLHNCNFARGDFFSLHFSHTAVSQLMHKTSKQTYFLHVMSANLKQFLNSSPLNFTHQMQHCKKFQEVWVWKGWIWNAEGDLTNVKFQKEIGNLGKSEILYHIIS